jgi:chromosomal replication initiator protein
MASVAARVAAKHGLTVADLRGQSRKRVFAWPRHEAFAECRALPRPLPMIGLYFGGRDHSTVWHGIRRHEERQAALAEAQNGGLA